MNATAYAATNITRFPAPRRLQQAAVAPRVTATTTPRVSASDVRDLIEAAGPLSMRDIAGGLGVTEREARAKGLRFKVAKIPMTHVARALESDETRGFMKAIVEAETDRILGAAVLGVAGGEVMTVLEVAMMGGLPYTAIRDGVFAHPTLSESLNNLFATIE